MALTLTIDRDAWDAHLVSTLATHRGCIPVVKGNGYGFGRGRLMTRLLALGQRSLAVGSVFELADVPADVVPYVLTPVGRDDAALMPRHAVPTVGSLAHLDALTRAGWSGRVVVKLASSMRRYGVAPTDLEALIDATDGAGCTIDAFGLHLPLAPSTANRDEVLAWLPHLPADLALHVSHLDVVDEDAVRAAAAGRAVRQRIGTRLWHGDRSMLHLGADVVDLRGVRAGDAVGYRATPCPVDGTLVMIAAGTAQGVVPLPDGRSPFHFARRRLELVEPPHMHTSIAVVPSSEPTPGVGDLVDVQRPLTQSLVDRVIER